MTSQATVSQRGFIDAAPDTSLRVPHFWEVTWNTLRRLMKGPLASPPPTAARDSLLLDACVSLRAGRVNDASAMLSPHRSVLARDAGYLNLLGVVCEVRRQWKLARRFYGVAMSVDSRHEPAQLNMRRMYELYTFGRSREPLALGDLELRRSRTLS